MIRMRILVIPFMGTLLHTRGILEVTMMMAKPVMPSICRGDRVWPPGFAMGHPRRAARLAVPCMHHRYWK